MGITVWLSIAIGSAAAGAVDGVRSSRPCDFVVGFAAGPAGADEKQMRNLRTYLDGNDALVEYGERKSGKRGERVFCVRAKKPDDRAAVKGHLDGIMAQSGGKDLPRGSVVICVAHEGRTPKHAACAERMPGEKPER